MPETVVLYKIVYHGVKCACVRREGIDKMKNKISRRSFLALRSRQRHWLCPAVMQKRAKKK